MKSFNASLYFTVTFGIIATLVGCGEFGGYSGPPVKDEKDLVGKYTTFGKACKRNIEIHSNHVFTAEFCKSGRWDMVKGVWRLDSKGELEVTYYTRDDDRGLAGFRTYKNGNAVRLLLDADDNYAKKQ
jgi:hypothetical protein